MTDLRPVSSYSPPALVLYPSYRPQFHYGITSWGLYRQHLGGFFPECTVCSPLLLRFKSKLDGVLAWGTKPSALSASILATRLSIPLLRIEDGFLYGLEPASSRMSLVADDLGIYYDARAPSKLESLIACALTVDQTARAQSIRGLWIEHGVSKYNHAPDWVLPNDAWFGEPFILLIDQTRGDQSIAGALADESSFLDMLEAAISQSAIEHIVIKVHPEVVRGTKLGHFDVSPGSAISLNPRIRVMADDYSLPSAIKEASAIYTVSSQAGFEALLWDKPVHTFGMPFYAGWGLTHDTLPRIRRRCNITLEQLIYATLIAYPRYLHPETNQLCEVEDLIAYLGFQRVMRSRFAQPLMPVGFSQNKLRHLKRFTQGAQWISGGGSSNEYHPRPVLDGVLSYGHAPYADGISVHWGSEHVHKDDCFAGCEQIQVEDGFIRSVGLGAALAKPYSWVFDRRGIYYDARSASDLEHILQTAVFDPSILTRASLLQEQIITFGISKYNLRKTRAARRDVAALQKAREDHPTCSFLLVIGQVESDASIRYGGVDVLTNAALLRVVREQHPDAFIVYKIHPDIAKSVRFSGGSAADHQKTYDLAVSEISLIDCLQWVDSLHTISSLSGFEALIRGVPVYCYGLPFYAGWGLTTDRSSCERRTRMLSLTELIAGALILYPAYLHPISKLYCSPEALITALHEMQNRKKGGTKQIYQFLVEFGARTLMGIIHRIKRI